MLSAVKIPEVFLDFEGLGLGPFQIKRGFAIGSFTIYWYAVIIVIGLILAVSFCMWKAKKFDLTSDNVLDVLLYGLPVGIICARAYYVIFKPAEVVYDSFLDMINIRDGGLAIYGGIIGAFAVGAIYCHVKKVNMLALFDLASLGFMIGQSIGRWGNFVNGEAYGGPTDLPWGMSINDRPPVHPTFFYESLWNVIGFFLLLLFVYKWKKNHGEVFFLYLAWYGLGRAMIEGMRADSLYIGPLRVSQVIAIAAVLGGVVLFILSRKGIIKVVQVHAADRQKKKSERYKPVYKPLFQGTALAGDDEVKQLDAASELKDESENKEDAENTEE